MATEVILPSKAVAADILVSFDFTAELGEGDTVTSAVVTSTVYSGEDATPNTMISGSASVAGGSVVSQKVIDGVEGVTYQLTCTASTTAGYTLVKQGLLSVLSSLL